MPRDVTYRALRHGEEVAACGLALDVFDATVAPGYSADGAAEFRRYADAAALAERLGQGHSVLVAERAGRLVGVVEVMDKRHVAMLFVDPAVHGRGIGGELLSRAIELSRGDAPDVTEFTVHAAPGAVPFYRRHGFRPRDAEREEHGIRYVPMVRRLD